MKKLLGTLQVWLDMDETRLPSGIQQVAAREWDLVMRPTKDIRLLPEAAGRAGFQTIMAHEMGHFIAQITRDPVSDKRNWAFGTLPDGSKTPSPLSVLGEEKLAWKLARIANPDLLPKIEEYALRGYQQGAEDEAFETGQLDRLQSFVFTLPEPEPDTFDGSDRWEDDGGYCCLDFYETRNSAPDLPRYTTPQDIAFYPEDAHSPTVLESHSPTFDKFMQDWAFQNAPVKAEPKPEPIEPMSTGQTIAAVLFLIALFSAISTVAGYALLGAIEVLR